MLYVYLAGPITGLTLEEASGWRENKHMLTYLNKIGYECLNPLRDKDHLEAYRGALPARYSDMEEREEVMADLDDLEKCDVVLANMAGASAVSVGTAWEMGWASARGTPVIAVVERGSVYDHLFVHQTSYAVVPDLFEAIAKLEDLAPKLRGPVYA